MYYSLHFHLLSNCYAVAFVLIMNIITSSPPDHPMCGCSCYPHFTREETEVQRG